MTHHTMSEHLPWSYISLPYIVRCLITFLCSYFFSLHLCKKKRETDYVSVYVHICMHVYVWLYVCVYVCLSLSLSPPSICLFKFEKEQINLPLIKPTAYSEQSAKIHNKLNYFTQHKIVFNYSQSTIINA